METNRTSYFVLILFHSQSGLSCLVPQWYSGQGVGGLVIDSVFETHNGHGFLSIFVTTERQMLEETFWLDGKSSTFFQAKREMFYNNTDGVAPEKKIQILQLLTKLSIFNF